MLRRLVFILTLLLVRPAVAHAQLLPADAAAPSSSASAAAPPVPTFAPPPEPSTTDAPRAPRNPAMRERNPPPSRAAAMARGSLMLVALVVLVGYGVIKRIRRRM